MERLMGTITPLGKLNGVISKHTTAHGSEYVGPYDVTPKIESQRFKTSGKYMVKDMKVTKIPYAEVTNPQGGTTVNIAWEEL